MWSQYLILGLRTSPTPKSRPDFQYVVKGKKASLRWVQHDADLVLELVHGLLLLTTESPVELHEALGYAHGVETIFSIAPFCSHSHVEDLSLLPLPDAVDVDQPLTVDRLLDEAFTEVITFYEDPILFKNAFLSGVIEGTGWLERHGELLRRFLDEAAFERSCSYLHRSMMDLGVDKCDWRESNFDQAFHHFVTIAKAESAFLNAFKAIESFVGEPSKNRTEQKLRERLARMSINADEPVGYASKRTVMEWILINHPFRDSIAAHGIGQQKRPLTIAEIVELQAVARYLLLASKSPGES